MATSTTQRTRRPRGSIDADMILKGAFEVARQEGLDGMSMPSLAKHLKVGVTSIYWYFRNKDDLLQQMHVKAFAQINQDLPSADDFTPTEWREYLTGVFMHVRGAYATNPVAAELTMNRHSGQSDAATIAVYERVESTLSYLVSAGFSPRDAFTTYSTLSMFTHNMVAMELARETTGFPPAGADAQLAMIDTARMPVLSRLVGVEGMNLDFTGPSFENGIELILDSAAIRRSARDSGVTV